MASTSSWWAFSGSLLPNDATNAGELDANVFQHRPYLEQDNKAHGYHPVAIGNTFVFPMAGYSRKIKSVADIKDGATIAIPNDPTNPRPRAIVIAKEQLITLKAGTGLLPTAVDITSNPRNLKNYGAGGRAAAAGAGRSEGRCRHYQYHLPCSKTGLSPVRDGIFIEDKKTRRT